MPALNPNKVYRYRILIDGVTRLLVQDITLPEYGSEVNEHGYGGDVPNQETTGKPTIGDMTLTKLQAVLDGDNELYTWFLQSITGIAGYKTIEVQEMNPLNASVSRAWVCTDVFPKNVSQNDLSKLTSENVMETATLGVHLFFPKDSQQARETFQII